MKNMTKKKKLSNKEKKSIRRENERKRQNLFVERNKKSSIEPSTNMSVSQRKKKSIIEQSKKMSVENTISYSYGCEVVNENDLPEFVNNFVLESGLNKVIKVPRRKRGMTSSGKRRHCHPNVELLVDNTGGKRMVGYEINMNEFQGIRFFDLLFHSVWMTPENKLVDVTEKDIPSSLHGEDVQYFIPVSTEDILLRDINHISSKNEKNEYQMGLFPEPMRKTTKKPSLEDLFVTNKGVGDMNGKDWKKGGCFTEPSISTGKYLPSVYEPPRKLISI